MRANLRDWALPFLAIIAATAGLFLATYSVDYAANAPSSSFFANLFAVDPNTVRYSLTAVAQSLAATLGLMAAIVLVIVQLSANRYTPKIIDSFTHNVTNFVIFSLFIASIEYALWVAHSVKGDFAPRCASLVAMCLMTVCFALVIPYFLFIFRILNPRHLIDQLRKRAITAIEKASLEPGARHDEMRRIVVRKVEQIGDVAMSCIQNVDEEVARHSVWALQGVINTYLQHKGKAASAPVRLVPEEDMTGSPRRLAEEIIKREAWVEFRALRQLRILYRQSSRRLPEISSLIAQAVRSFGVASADRGDVAVLEIVVMFFNSLVRSAVSLKDGRACSDTLYQYRLLAEKILETRPALAERIVEYFMYYGRMLLLLEIRQIFDTLCYDIRKINEKAFKLRAGRPPVAPDCAAILQRFLGLHAKLDRSACETQWRALLKHYVNLASFYVHHGAEDFAEAIFQAIRGTPTATLEDIQQEILSVTDPLFWEISDRVINFNFISSEQRESLQAFIRRFTHAEPPLSAAHPTAPAAGPVGSSERPR